MDGGAFGAPPGPPGGAGIGITYGCKGIPKTCKGTGDCTCNGAWLFNPGNKSITSVMSGKCLEAQGAAGAGSAAAAVRGGRAHLMSYTAHTKTAFQKANTRYGSHRYTHNTLQRVQLAIDRVYLNTSATDEAAALRKSARASPCTKSAACTLATGCSTHGAQSALLVSRVNLVKSTAISHVEIAMAS